MVKSMFEQDFDFDDIQPCFMISIVSQMITMHPQTIRHYEEIGLIKPERTRGNKRLYSKKDIQVLNKIQSYTNLGINLAGVDIILKLLEQIHEKDSQIQELKKKIGEI
jgi:MerR family transcriptional regulator/heat shock protein HspR